MARAGGKPRLGKNANARRSDNRNFARVAEVRRSPFVERAGERERATLFTNGTPLLVARNDPRTNFPRVITRRARTTEKVTSLLSHLLSFVRSLPRGRNSARVTLAIIYYRWAFERIGSHKWGCKGRYVEQPAVCVVRKRRGIHFVIF